MSDFDSDGSGSSFAVVPSFDPGWPPSTLARPLYLRAPPAGAPRPLIAITTSVVINWAHRPDLHQRINLGYTVSYSQRPHTRPVGSHVAFELTLTEAHPRRGPDVFDAALSRPLVLRAE